LTKKFDVIWIGTGQATGTMIPRLVAAGKTVAIVEGGKVGGSCVNYGCTPTKTLVASARAAHVARRGPDFGVQTGKIKIDFYKVMNRQNQMRHDASQGMETWLSGMDGVTIYPEYALCEGSHTITVGDKIIEAETIVINAGGRPRLVPIIGIENVDWLDNARLLDLDELPTNLVIIGGSYISLEFAQIFRRLGSQVTVLEAGPQLMFREDPDIAEAAQEILEKEGISFHLNASIEQILQPDEKQIDLIFTQNGEN